MSHKKDKARWQRVQENKNKGCITCVHLKQGPDGNFRCYLDKNTYRGTCVVLYPEDIKRNGKACESYIRNGNI